MNLFSQLFSLKNLKLKKNNVTIKDIPKQEFGNKIEDENKPTTQDVDFGVISADDKVKKLKRPPDAEIPPHPKPKHEYM